MWQEVGHKKQKRETRNAEPWWKRRIQRDIKRLQKYIGVLERKKRGELRKRGKYKMLERRYKIKGKGLNVVLEELKQRTAAKKAKVNRYVQRMKQYLQNRMFNVDQKKFYQELNGESRQEKIIPDAEESKIFWSSIWDNTAKHNDEAEWLQELKEDMDYPLQDDLHISKDKVQMQSRKMPNWKAPGPEGVLQGFWIKKLTACHQRIAEQLDKVLNEDAELPEWMTCGRTVLCLNDPARGNAADNFRPISRLPLMWKLMTGIIAENMYGFLESNEILSNEQKVVKEKVEELMISYSLIRTA